MENNFIKVENVSFVYNDDYDSDNLSVNFIPALKNINLSIKKGEYVAILGHNGSGKSTLAKLLNLILVPQSGRIFIEGRDITSPDFSEDDVFEIRKKVGMVFQNPDNQIVANVVEEDVAFGPENLGLEREEIRRRVISSLDLVGMTEYTHHAPHKLSGGQKQRVAIAGIIAMKPDCIIFDESTAMLDPIGRHDVVSIMEKLNKNEGITILNITHYMDEAARADRIIVMNDGEITLDDTPKKIFKRVDYLHSIGLEAPQAVELKTKLSDFGIDISSDGITDDEIVSEIEEYIKRNLKGN